MKRSYAGQAIVETALVSVILLSLVFGGITALQYVLSSYMVAQSARNGAHVAALRGSLGGLPNGQSVRLGEAQGSVAEVVRATLSSVPFVDANAAWITASCASTPCRRYDWIEIRVRYDAEAWAPFPGFPSTMTLEAQARRTAEQDSTN